VLPTALELSAAQLPAGTRTSLMASAGALSAPKKQRRGHHRGQRLLEPAQNGTSFLVTFLGSLPLLTASLAIGLFEHLLSPKQKRSPRCL
jgi:hypothetical protein